MMRHVVLMLSLALLPVPAQETVPGRVKAAREIVVSAEVTGRVIARPVPRNSKVKKGQVVVEIDPTLYAIAVDRTRALVEQADARAEVAASELKRGEDLARGESLNPSELDNLKANARAAKAAADVARANLAEAEEMLARTKLRAPADGLVSEILPEIGESLAPGTPTFHLLTIHDLVVETFLAAEQLAGLRRDQELEVKLDTPQEIGLKGRIRELAGAAGPKRTFRLVVELADPPPGVRAGFVARIVLPKRDQRR